MSEITGQTQEATETTGMVPLLENLDASNSSSLFTGGFDNEKLSNESESEAFNRFPETNMKSQVNEKRENTDSMCSSRPSSPSIVCEGKALNEEKDCFLPSVPPVEHAVEEDALDINLNAIEENQRLMMITDDESVSSSFSFSSGDITPVANKDISTNTETITRFPTLEQFETLVKLVQKLDKQVGQLMDSVPTLKDGFSCPSINTDYTILKPNDDNLNVEETQYVSQKPCKFKRFLWKRKKFPSMENNDEQSSGDDDDGRTKSCSSVPKKMRRDIDCESELSGFSSVEDSDMEECAMMSPPGFDSDHENLNASKISVQEEKEGIKNLVTKILMKKKGQRQQEVSVESSRHKQRQKEYSRRTRASNIINFDYLSTAVDIDTWFKKPPTAPELTLEMFQTMQSALNGPPDKILVTGFSLELLQSDLSVLNDSMEWINDRNIDFYLELIKERNNNLKQSGYPQVYIFHSFFYTLLTEKYGGYEAVRETTRDDDIFEYDLIFFPINLKNHWRLIVVDLHDQNGNSILCYDSFSNRDSTSMLKTIFTYLTQEYQNNRASRISNNDPKNPLANSSNEWIMGNAAGIPKQKNGIDCGVFVLQFAEYLSREKEFDFDQSHIEYFRKRMVFEILTKQLLT